jgi:HEPN domain-containing protein
MGKLKRECPHCHSKYSSFQSYGEIKKTNTKNHTTAFFCEGCFGGYIAVIENNISPTAHGHQGDIEDSNGYYRIIMEYPQPEGTEAPLHIPDNIKNFYLQAANSLKSGSLDAASIMARKVLEVSVKTLAPETSGSLYKRIEKLYESGGITADLKDWAHIIREDGNEAAHEEVPVTEQYAEELLAFAEMFLMYTFTMPGMVTAKRQETEQDNV